MYVQVGYIVLPGRLTFRPQPEKDVSEEGVGVVSPLTENLRAIEAERLIEKTCKENDIGWLRKAGRVWQLDLSAFKRFFNEASDKLAWAEGVVQVQPEIHHHHDQQRVSFGDFGAIRLSERTTVSFTVHKDEFLTSRENEALMMRRVGAMIGSPGDATQERQAITDTILRWNAVNGADKGIFLEPIKWETHATPGLEGRPQGMINEELIPMSDFLIAVFRVRAGSPTGKEISGTIEEIREFMALGKYVAVYFYEGETSVKGLDPDQLKKVQDFKKEIQQHGLVESYSTVADLQAKLALHLSAIVKRLESKKPGAKSGRATAASRTRRPTTSLPTAPPATAPKKPKRSPRQKAGDDGANEAVDESGQWVLLNTRFYEARTVRQNKDQTFSVEIHSRSAQIDAAISALRPHHFGKGTPIPFAHANDAWIVTVKDVEMVSEGQGQLWTVSLTPQDVEYGGGVMEMALNMGGRHYSSDDIARMRAGRILLNDPPAVGDKPRPGSDQALLEGAMLESHIQGVNTPASAKDCIIRAVYGEYKDKPRLFLQVARLAAIYFLKASGVVEQVRQLTLGPLKKGKVHVRLQGVRRKKYSNVDPVVIDLEGDCPLD